MLKLNLGCGKFPLDGFLNFDMRTDLSNKFEDHLIIDGWRWQQKFPFFIDNCVDAITTSHSLMYCTIEEYEDIFKDIYRILKINGIFRITEDDCEYPDCKQYGLPWGNPASKTGPIMMRHELEKTGFVVYDMDPKETHYKDDSLIQQFHGTPPRVFHIEAIKVN